MACCSFDAITDVGRNKGLSCIPVRSPFNLDTICGFAIRKRLKHLNSNSSVNDHTFLCFARDSALLGSLTL